MIRRISRIRRKLARKYRNYLLEKKTNETKINEYTSSNFDDNRELEQLYQAIQQNDPTIITVDASSWKTTGSITLGEALRGNSNNSANNNQHIQSLEMSVDQIYNVPSNTPETSAYVYEYIRTSHVLRTVKLIKYGWNNYPHFEDDFAKKYMKSVAYNTYLLEVHLISQRTTTDIPTELIIALLQRLASLKTLILERITLTGIILYPSDSSQLELAQALGIHRTLQHFRIRCDGMWYMTTFIAALFQQLTLNSTVSAMHTLEVYGMPCSEGPVVMLSSPAIESSLLTFLSSTTTLKHLGLSYDFSSKTSIDSLMAGVQNATCPRLLNAETSCPLKITLDNCGFREEALAALVHFTQDKSIMAHVSLIEPYFMGRHGYSRESSADGMSQLLRHNACIRELVLPESHCEDFPVKAFDNLFKTMYEATISGHGGALPLEKLDTGDKFIGGAIVYFLGCLPHLLKLHTLHTKNIFLCTDPGRIVHAFRKNASLKHVTLQTTDNLSFVNCIQAYCQRNQQLPYLLVQPGTGGNTNDAADSGTEIEQLPSMFQAATHMPRMGPSMILIGLLSWGNSIPGIGTRKQRRRRYVMSRIRRLILQR